MPGCRNPRGSLSTLDNTVSLKPFLTLEVVMTINVNLGPQLEDMVRQKVASGLYTSASEVVREALRLMEAQGPLNVAKLDPLRQDIREGLDSGEPTPWDAEAIKREGRQRRTAHASGKPAA